MAEKFDSDQILTFLRRAGEDLRKTGEELREEAQRLLAEVRDPENQQRVREGIQDIGNWFRRTTSDASERLEQAVKKAESTLREQADRVRGGAKRSPTASTESSGGKKAPRRPAAAKRATKRPKKQPTASKGVSKRKRSPRA